MTYKPRPKAVSAALRRFEQALETKPLKEINVWNLRFFLKQAVHMLSALEQPTWNQGDLQRALRKYAGRLAVRPVKDGTAFKTKGFYVYCLWDKAGKCLYVGQSRNVLARLGAHLGNSKKHSEVDSITLIECSDQATMMETEADLILRFNAPWNVHGKHKQVVVRMPPTEEEKARLLEADFERRYPGRQAHLQAVAERRSWREQREALQQQRQLEASNDRR